MSTLQLEETSDNTSQIRHTVNLIKSTTGTTIQKSVSNPQVSVLCIKT